MGCCEARDLRNKKRSGAGSGKITGPTVGVGCVELAKRAGADSKAASAEGERFPKQR